MNVENKYIVAYIDLLGTKELIKKSNDEFVRKYMGKSSGSTVTGIRVRLLEQLTIPVPPRKLQDEFSVFVDQVDKSKVAVQKALNEAQLLFDSLMQEYFG